MTPYLRVLFASMFFMALAMPARSQRYLGLATSDWSAINSLYLNPASIADCRETISIGIFSLNAGVDNNLGFIPKIPGIGNTINNSDNIFTQSQRSAFSMMVPAAVVRGPGVMFTLSKKMSIAFTTDIRAINQFNNFDPAIYKMFSQDAMLPNQDYTANAKNFNWTAHMWSEVGLSYAAVIWQGYKSRLNLGFTVRRLGGIGYISVVGKNLDLDYRPDSNKFSAKNSDIEFASNVTNDSSTAFKNINPLGLFHKFFGETAGAGTSADFGLTYRYRIGEPENSDYMESNLIHDLVLSVAVTDFGAIQYYNSTNDALSITGSGNLTAQGVKERASINVASMADYAKQNGFNVVTETGTRKVRLPTALVTSADVQVYGRFFVNMLFIGNLANRNVFGNSYYDQFTITPRYDFHKMTIALPITYSALAHDIKLGCAVRYKGFFIGSDDAMALLSKYQYGFDLYFGGYIPIFKRHNDPAHLHWGLG